MKSFISTNYFLVIFFGIYILPSFFSYLLESSSKREGLSIGMVLMLLLSLNLDLKNVFKINSIYFNRVLLIVGLMLLQFAMSLFFYTGSNINRAIFSLLFLLVVIYASVINVNLFSMIKEIYLYNALSLSFYFLLVIGIISVFLYYYCSSCFSSYSKYMIIFTEPSHYALNFQPFLLFKCYMSPKYKKVIYICLSISISILLLNVTMIVSTILVAILVLYKDKTLILTILVSSIIVIYSYGDSNYFISRISMNPTNSTVISYLSGWERAHISLVETAGVGLGFQQMGVKGDQGKYCSTGPGCMNLFDGSNTSSKIIVEFGVIGILFLILYIVYFVRVIRAFIKKRLTGISEIFFSSVYVMFSIELLYGV